VSIAVIEMSALRARSIVSVPALIQSSGMA
jgi:hypothetical protein